MLHFLIKKCKFVTCCIIPWAFVYEKPGYKCMMKLFTCILTGLLLSVTVAANNVRVNGKLIPVATPDGLVQLNFSLSWENAWNDPYNWDAVWAFVKYRKKSDNGAWKHGYLAPAGHSATGVNVCISGSNDLFVGAFLFPQANGGGNLEDKGVSLVLASNDITLEDALSDRVDFSVQLIEMVLVPEGPFYAGDGGAVNCFTDVDDSTLPALIEGESGVQVKIGGNKVALSDYYPKGYAGFYAMKYELSQAQYVDFLNKLSRDQQQVAGRVPVLGELKPGDYIFGDKEHPNARNGIVVYVNEPDRPAIFACNLNRDHKYNAEDDGQTLACNFISLWEMMNYCDWAGLRPMSELEFEKACRKPYPELPVAGEYAWNSTVLSPIGSEADITNPYSEREYVTAADKNVNSGNRVGPLRCGVFSYKPAGVTRETAGATCSGLMEMSGNLREICYTAEAVYRYQKTVADYLGDGELNASGVTNVADNYWPKLPVNFIPKGGGYTSANAELQISDRSMTGHITDGQFRDSTLGFRAVRNVPAPATYVDPGKVVGSNGNVRDSVCSDPNVVTYQILNDRLPSFIGDMSGMRFNYKWYLRKGEGAWELLRGENNATLNYQDAFENTTNQPLAWQFRRDVIFPGGTISSPVVEVYILNIDPVLSSSSDLVDACDISTGITITTSTEAVFDWKYSNGITFLHTSGTSSIYRPKRKDFIDAPDASPYQVVCDITAGRCAVSRQFDITVESATADPNDCPCGATIVDDDGYEYPTIEIGTQCWMTKNLMTGLQVDLAKLEEVYKTGGIQRGCYGDNSANCTAYGALYPWWEVLCGGMCSSSFNSTPGQLKTPGRALVQATMEKYGVKYSADKKYIQGICPDGWHVPSDGEWSVLEAYIGMNKSAIEASTWARKMDAVDPSNPDVLKSVKVLMKSYGYMDNVWCEGGDCDKTGFNAYFGGYIEKGKSTSEADVVADDKLSVRWWTSSPGGTSSPNTYVRGITISRAVAGKMIELPTMGRHNDVPRNSFMYVRCIKDL